MATEMATGMESRKIAEGDGCNELPGTPKVERSSSGEHGARMTRRESGSA